MNVAILYCNFVVEAIQMAVVISVQLCKKSCHPNKNLSLQMLNIKVRGIEESTVFTASSLCEAEKLLFCAFSSVALSET